MEGSTKKRVKRGCLGVFVLGIAFAAWFYGPLVVGLWRAGFFERKPSPHAYEGDSRKNLELIRTALLGYEESEGIFPEGAGWMDAIQNRLKTDDLKKGEGQKKLVRPDLLEEPDSYGYAFNDVVGGQYHGDIKDPKTPLVFESTATERNAHGDPKKIAKPGGLVITVGGQIVKQ
jgi:hypothetical protein